MMTPVSALRAEAEELCSIDQSLFDALSAHIALVGEAGTILRVNDAWRRFAEGNAGTPDKVLEGADYLGTCEASGAQGCETAAEFAAGLRAVLAGTSPGFMLEYGCDSPTEQRWFAARVTQFTTGGRRRAVVAHEDISARRLAEQQLAAREQHFSSLLASSLDLIATIDVNGIYQYVSPSHEAVLGYRPDDLIGSNALLLVHPDDVARAMVSIGVAIEQPDAQITLEYRVRHRDGSWRVIEAFGKRLPDQLPIVGILNARDITERKRAEEALRQSEDRFRSAFENAPIGVVIVAPDGRFLQANRAFCDIVGYSADELVHGTRFQDITHPGDIDADVQLLREMLAGQRTRYELEKRYINRAGLPVHVRLHVSLVRDAAGAPLHVIGQVVDESERKRAEAMQRRLVRAVEAAAEGIVLTDAEGHILQVNPAFTRLTGYAAADVVGRRPPLLHRNLHDVDTYAAFWRAIRAGETWAGRVIDRRADGSHYHVAVTVAPIIDDKGVLTGFVGIHRDVTEDIRREDALADALQRAEGATRAKSEFLANMSHEIRTPMNGILGMTELALATQLDAEQREYLELVKSSADSLLGIIDDILDFSKIEAGKLALEPGVFDLRAVFDTTLKTLGLRAREKGIALTWEVDASVPAALVGDATRLRQIITNLVGNGIKFTAAGVVSVRAVVTEQRGDVLELHVTVSDTGVGVAPDRQERIFAAFEQVDASISRRFGGTGLGLTISARLVGMMGGRIWVESTPAVGSAFHFTVALGLTRESVAAGKPGEPPAAPAVAARALHVLLAEDNVVNQRLVLRLLQKRGHSVVVAGNGREALAAAGRERFDAVLMDVQMPEMDGFEATAALRAREAGAAQHLPIIAMTAHAMKGDRERCLAAGMDDYVTKPIRAADLFAVLERWAVEAEIPPASSPSTGED